MERHPFERKSIYDEELLARRKDASKRGRSRNMEEEWESDIFSCRSKTNQDTVKLPSLIPGNQRPPTGKNSSRRPEFKRTSPMTPVTAVTPDLNTGSFTRLPDLNAPYDTPSDHDGNNITKVTSTDASEIDTTTAIPHKKPDRLKSSSFLPDIGTSCLISQQRDLTIVKATPSDNLTSDFGYKITEAQRTPDRLKGNCRLPDICAPYSNDNRHIAKATHSDIIASEIGQKTTRPQKNPDLLKRSSVLPNIGTSCSTVNQHHGMNAVKATTSDTLASEFSSYKNVDAEKKREWDLRYERMLRDRQEMREYNKRNAPHNKEPLAFDPVRSKDAHGDRYASRSPSHSKQNQRHHVTGERRVAISTSQGCRTADDRPAGGEGGYDFYSDTQQTERGMDCDGKRETTEKHGASVHCSRLTAEEPISYKPVTPITPMSTNTCSTINHGHHIQAPPKPSQSSDRNRPTPPVNPTSSHTSYSKTRRRLKVRDTDINKTFQCPSLHLPPTEFIEFASKIGESSKLDQRIRVARTESSKDASVNDEVDFDDFLNDLDDILKSPDTEKSASKYRRHGK